MSIRGQRILITRAAEQQAELASRLRDRGAVVSEVATIAVKPRPAGPLPQADWWVFTSPNGVRCFFAEAVLPPGVKVAAVGPATAAALAERGVAVDLMPDRFDGERLAQAMQGEVPLAGKRVVLARGNLAGDDLPTGLAAAGATVIPHVVYDTVSVPMTAEALGPLTAGEVDWVVFASGSAFRSLIAALGDARALETVRLASIGPKTSAVIRESGLAVAAEAEEATLEGLVAAIEAAAG